VHRGVEVHPEARSAQIVAENVAAVAVSSQHGLQNSSFSLGLFFLFIEQSSDLK
jgi:hypothetical protein